MSVYFARVRDYVKIGFSDDVYERMSSITYGSAIKPDDVESSDSVDLLGWIPGTRATETSTHNRFGHLHVVGEWYWDDDCYEAAIETDPFGVPIASLSAQAAYLMEHDSTVTRQQAVEIVESVRQQQLADPTSHLSQLRQTFTAEFVASIAADATRRRADERRYWREQRTAA